MSALRVALCLNLALVVAAAAEAQTARPPRSTRGLFGPQNDQPRRPQTIDFTMSLNEGYDNSGTDRLAVDSLSIPYRQAGLYSNLEAGLRYTRVRRERRLTATAGTAVRYYPVPYKLLLPNYQGGISFASPLWRSGRLAVSQDFGYTPSYQLDVFPTLSLDAAHTPNPTPGDYAMSKQPAYMSTSGIQFVQILTPRSALQFAYDRRSVMLSGHAGDLMTQGGGIKFTHHVSRYAGVHAGIGSRLGQYARSTGPTRVWVRDVDIGLDYDRPLSFSRRTTLRFASGSSLVPQDGKTYYRVTGNVSLAHEIGRSWTAILRYDRRLQFIEALPRPFFSDAVAASVTGHPSRKVDLALAAAYSAGAIGVAGDAGGLGAYTGSASIGLSLNRHLALSSEYLYYHYRFDQQSLAAFPARLDRQTVRIGLKLWFPLE